MKAADALVPVAQTADGLPPSWSRPWRRSRRCRSAVLPGLLGEGGKPTHQEKVGVLGSLLRPGYLPIRPFFADEIRPKTGLRDHRRFHRRHTGVEDATGLKPRDAACGPV